MPDGFGVAVVREDGKWRCSSMRKAALNSLTAAETELRGLIGRLYLEIGVFDKSEEMHRAALEICRKFLGPESLAAATSPVTPDTAISARV